MLARTPAIFLVYMESCVGAFGPNGRGCLPGCLEGGQKCPQNVRSVPFLVIAEAKEAATDFKIQLEEAVALLKTYKEAAKDASEQSRVLHVFWTLNHCSGSADR